MPVHGALVTSTVFLNVSPEFSLESDCFWKPTSQILQLLDVEWNKEIFLENQSVNLLKIHKEHRKIPNPEHYQYQSARQYFTWQRLFTWCFCSNLPLIDTIYKMKYKLQISFSNVSLSFIDLHTAFYTSRQFPSLLLFFPANCHKQQNIILLP
ncbi:hypothetical protein T4B_2085 [Trichinella pseudospiralis]|uniref:Uncharacterized protein n=1 Tax=Trichinella pseudospiralis TaxID=6337 RepID=A0A0V1K7T7_TRIPS|nr:hypothetical protein T4A_10368 [Trichinella pseudospiralis]KRZ31123.1 hypothetical protein T4B_2085 [Trichinella pseudospiralis]KRZ43303.1 hypothetical protein T4C_5512 [Trichinella pseudospiralis]